MDYVESYSPLATNTTVKVVLAMALYYMGYFVEAAFLNALLDTDVFIKMPEGLRELLLSQGVMLGDVVINLLRAQYGPVQSPRLLMELFSKILVSIGLKQCKTDPCLFCLFDKNGKLLAIVVVYCNDCLITGRTKAVADIKAGISRHVKIEDLGKLSRHLGVDYKFGRDEHRPYILSSMNHHHKSMIRDFEKDIGSSLKTFLTPGAAVTPPLRSTPEDEIILNDEYRSYVGRIMFACGKTEPTLSNVCREMTSHLTAPNKALDSPRTFDGLYQTRNEPWYQDASA